MTPLPGVSRQYSKPSIYLPDCTNPKDHDDADLCQQRRMAKAAEDGIKLGYWQLGVGIAATLISVLAVMLSGWAAWEASIAARQAILAVNNQMKIDGPLIHVQRVITDRDHPSILHVSVRNSGKTPAMLVNYCIGHEAGRERLRQAPTYEHVAPINSKLLSPGEETTLINFAFDLQPMFDTAKGCVWGFLRYQDVFGRQRRLGFGFRCNVNPLLMLDDLKPPLIWSRDGGDAYNYDREEPEA